MPTAEGPLAGVRVIELGSMYAAPTAGRMLRDFGADVIKVEDPARVTSPVNGSRSTTGWRSASPGSTRVSGRSGSTSGRPTAVRWSTARGADVVIENFRPGRMEAWGMDYKALSDGNPGLVMTG